MAVDSLPLPSFDKIIEDMSYEELAQVLQANREAVLGGVTEASERVNAVSVKLKQLDQFLIDHRAL